MCFCVLSENNGFSIKALMGGGGVKGSENVKNSNWYRWQKQDGQNNVMPKITIADK